MPGCFAGIVGARVPPDDIQWDARVTDTLRNAANAVVPAARHPPGVCGPLRRTQGQLVARWNSVRPSLSVRALVASGSGPYYTVDAAGRPGLRDLGQQYNTPGFRLFHRACCVVYTVNSTNFWYWYGSSDAVAGAWLLVSTGEIRYRPADNVQSKVNVGVAGPGVPAVLTFQFSQEGANIVFRALHTTLTAVAVTTVANRTLGTGVPTTFSAGFTTPDLTTHALTFTEGVLSDSQMLDLHSATKVSWGIA